MKIEHVTALRETMERMETQQLDAMLLEELRKDSPNGELIRMIGRILKARDRELVPEIDDNIRQAWEQYQRKAQPIKKKPKGLNCILVKAASLILVVLTLMALVPQEAEASNFFQRLIAWTEEVFALVNPLEEVVQEAYVFHTNHPGLQEVYDKVTELGITEPVVPMWIPEGYELMECVLVDNPVEQRLTSFFSNGKTDAVHQLIVYSDNATYKYYKNETDTITIEKNGISYTIMDNNDLMVVVWTIDNIQCSIAIDCQEDILNRILDSIYRTEEN